MTTPLFGSTQPIRLQTRDRLKRMLSEGGYQKGDPLPPYKELCRRFKVSIVTMKQAMDELKSEGWVHGRQGKGTFLSKDIPGKKRDLNQIGVLFYCGRQTLFATPYLMRIFQGIMMEADRFGFNVCTYSSFSDGGLTPEAFQESGSDGAIMVGIANQDYLSTFARSEFPIAVADECQPNLALDFVVGDNASASQKTVDHLTKRGHQCLAYVDGYSVETLADSGRKGQVIETFDVVERRKGFLHAAREAGVEDLARVISIPSDPTRLSEHVYQTWKAMRPRPTALVAFDTSIAQGMIRTFQKNGVRIPHDVSVAGVIGDTRLTVDNLIISSGLLDFVKMGKQAVVRLRDRCLGKRPSQARINRIDVQFEPGTSCTSAEPIRKAQAQTSVRNSNHTTKTTRGKNTSRRSSR